MDRIFDSGNYDSLIVLTSIKILSQHWKIDNDMVVTSQSIRQLAIDTINSKAESGTIKIIGLNCNLYVKNLKI